MNTGRPWTPAPDRPAWGRRWFMALRPWGAILSLFPVLWGTLLAVREGGAEFHFFHFILALAAMMLMHHGANMLGDVTDYHRGVDREVQPTSGSVVRGWCDPDDARRAAFCLIGAGCLLGLYLAWRVTWLLLLPGIIGGISAWMYTRGPAALKYHGLGDVAVFLNFGVLGSLGAWMVQTGRFDWLPAVWSVPFSMLVVAVLHANNWRDLQEDIDSRVTTVAVKLGFEGSRRYYAALVIGAYAVLALLLIGHAFRPEDLLMPGSYLIVFLSAPISLPLLRRSRQAQPDGERGLLIDLDDRTAKQLIGPFCLLSLIAPWLPM